MISVVVERDGKVWSMTADLFCSVVYGFIQSYWTSSFLILMSVFNTTELHFL